MRYMFLVYSRETDFAETSAEHREQVKAGHWAVMDGSRRKGVFIAGEPLQAGSRADGERCRARLSGAPPCCSSGGLTLCANARD